MNNESILRQGIEVLELELDNGQIRRLLDFLKLLQKWNKVYNLTAVRNPQEMLTHHVLDSLAVVTPLCRQLAIMKKTTKLRLLDVGSGAGLPGVVFAICCSELEVYCVDAVAKKTAFIQQTAVTLALPQLQAIHAKVETLCEPFDIVSCRAFATLTEFTRLTRPCLTPQGIWLAMKGKLPKTEINALGDDVNVFHVEHLAVPKLDAQRCIVWMRPVFSVPN